MKRVIYFILASFALFSLSSCVKDGYGDEANVTLAVSIPTADLTTAYGDGEYADINLVVGVFDENDNEKFRRTIVMEKGEFEANVSISFVMGKKYHIVLWAQYGNAYGNPATMPLNSITMDYSASNRENLDAFYAHVPLFEVRQDFTQNVVLHRPFAQLNFATVPGDADESVADDYLGLPATATVTVSSLANTLNLFTGEATYVDSVSKAESAGAKVTIPATAFPKDENGKYYTMTVENVTYEVISMNYVLVADSEAKDGKTTVDLTLQVGELEIDVPNAYMKRNWKTNVVGELLTAEGSFKVTVEPDFDGAYNNNWNESEN